MNIAYSTSYFFRRAFIFVLFAAVLDPIFFMPVLPDFVRVYFGFFAWVIWFFLSIFFYSGVYGGLVANALDEECAADFYVIRSKAKSLWRFYALVFAIPYVIHFFVFVFFPQGSVWTNFRMIRALCDVPMLLISVSVILGVNRAGVGAMEFLKDICVSLRVFAVVGAALAVVFLERVYYQTPTSEIGWLNTEFIFTGRIVHFALLSLLLSRISLLMKSKTDGRENGSQNRPEVYFVEPAGIGIFQSLALKLLQGSGVYTIIKALTPPHYRVREFTRVPFQEEMFCGGKLVAMTCFTSNCAEAYWIARRFREKGSVVVMGGPHVMFVPDEALCFCDSVVIGDAETVWRDIIHDYESGTLKRIYRGSSSCLSGEAQKRILQLPRADIRRVIQMGRGCKFHCDFCSIAAMANGSLRQTSVSETLELIQAAARPGERITFLDNNIYADPARARELFRALIPLGIKWQASCSIDLARHPDDLRLARQSGCRGLLIGYEVSSADSSEIKKGGKFSFVHDYVSLTKKIYRAGIPVKAHFIFGFENQTWQSLVSTWLLAFQLFPLCSVIMVLTPFTGTKFFHHVFQQGRAINLNWEKYSGVAMVFAHPKLSHRLVNAVYPVLYIFFFLTTSRLGLLVLISEILVLAAR